MIPLPFHRATNPSDPRADRLQAARRAFAARPFMTVMAVATVLAGIYYALIAAPLFTSTTRFAIRGSETVAAALPANLLAGLGTSQSDLSEITAVAEYIRSPDMLRELDKRLHLREQYSRPRLDLLHRLPRNASQEDFLRFYRKQVIVRLDRDASLVEVEVRGFDRDSAYRTASTILVLTESFVDGLSRRIRDETMMNARSELAKAQQEVEAARSSMSLFRSSHGDVNPSASGMQALGGIAELEAQISAARAEMSSLMTYTRPGAPQVRQVQARIATLMAQANALRAGQGGGAGDNMSNRVTQYETLLVQREIAEKRLASALAAYDTARATAEQRERFVVRVVQPNRPQEATQPNRLTDFLLVLIFVMTGYALTMLVVAGIRDHQGV